MAERRTLGRGKKRWDLKWYQVGEGGERVGNKRKRSKQKFKIYKKK